MATATPAGQDDLVTVITNDHRAVERIFTELESGRGSPRQRRDLADHMITELVRHSVADIRHHVQDEEQQLLPRLQDACSTEEMPRPTPAQIPPVR